MKVTEVFLLLKNEDKLKAFANVVLEDCFVVRGLKVIKGSTGYFVSMPSRKMPDGSYRDIAHAITNEFREILETAVLEAYQTELNSSDEMHSLPRASAKTFDVFISHASEDKPQVAKPLATYLKRRGLKVWIDDFELKVGDSLASKIDQGLLDSRFGVVILSPNFFKKKWPKRELEGLVAKENEREKVILPIWHNVTVDEVFRFSPILADKLAVPTTQGITYVGREIYRAVRGEPY